MSTDKATQEALLKALRKGQADKMARLLDADVQGVTVDMAADSASNSILHRAARYGHSDVVEVRDVERICQVCSLHTVCTILLM